LKRRDKAINALGRAAKIEPQSARHGHVYAVALNSAGRVSYALEALQQTAARYPRDRDTPMALIGLSWKTRNPITKIQSDKIDGRECIGVRVERFHESFDVWIASSGAPLPCELLNRRNDGAANILDECLCLDRETGDFR
jgi:hypothetical protein